MRINPSASVGRYIRYKSFKMINIVHCIHFSTVISCCDGVDIFRPKSTMILLDFSGHQKLNPDTRVGDLNDIYKLFSNRENT